MIKLIAVGKIKEKSLETLIEMYFKRIKPYTKIEIKEVKDFSNFKETNVALNEEVKEKEATEILKHISDRDVVVLIDLHGKEMDSIQFANHLDKMLAESSKDICYVIAGSLGFGKQIIARSNYRICLGKLTYPHQIVRMLVLEQLYRSFKILKNEAYHK
ncbi:MAG: 23S rRNA (pseudouridine(1915)-N(3))-methyltransferase RlmH [Erysipelotrichaceae bacterium]